MDSQTLVAQLQQINLWPEEGMLQAEITQLQKRLPDARSLGKELLSRNLLTPYQANQILTGKGQTLVVGPYRIDERLGEGASAQVFKAHHFRHHRVVALKIIRPERIRDNPQAVERFLREAQAAAALSHPNVVRAYDVAQESGVYYFAMQFLDGVDLARLVEKEGKLDIARACDYVLQAARGLQHIHENGMLHRDLKPSNLMVSKGDAGQGSEKKNDFTSATIKILDLGLARLNEDPAAPSQQAALTKLGTVMGTPDFMAPEQALHSRHADIRSDIYSLGCTFYFALTGGPPFPGGDAIEKMLKHQLDSPTPIEELRPEVPTPVRSILNKMMAKKKADRFQTPEEVIQALQSYLEPPARAIPVRAISAPLLPAADAMTVAFIPTAPPESVVPTATQPHPVAMPETPLFMPNENLFQGDLPPLMPSPLVRVPSRLADWGLWVFLAFVGVGAIVCLIVAVRIVLR